MFDRPESLNTWELRDSLSQLLVRIIEKIFLLRVDDILPAQLKVELSNYYVLFFI